MIKTIKRGYNKTIQCDLTLSDGGINPKYILTTNTNGHINSYEITAIVCGLNDCKESSLYLMAQSVKFMGDYYTTNEESLIDEAVIEIFEELTQS